MWEKNQSRENKFQYKIFFFLVDWLQNQHALQLPMRCSTREKPTVWLAPEHQLRKNPHDLFVCYNYHSAMWMVLFRSCHQ